MARNTTPNSTSNSLPTPDVDQVVLPATTDVETPHDVFETPVEENLTMIRLEYWMVKEWARPEQINAYIGLSIGSMMKDAVGAPEDAQVIVDGETREPSWLIPEGFSPVEIIAIKKSGEKG